MDILFVSANCAGEYIDIEREHRVLQKLVETGGHSLRVLPAAEVDDVCAALSANRKTRACNILHFSGHATRTEGLHLRGTGRRKAFLSARQLQDFLKGSGIELVVLNACNSEALAISLSEVVPSVIATTRAIPDLAARRFAQDFYGDLKAHNSVRRAFYTALANQKQADTPAYIRLGRKPLSSKPSGLSSASS